jgi:quercetin dioxygenase-like cupin family protein
MRTSSDCSHLSMAGLLLTSYNVIGSADRSLYGYGVAQMIASAEVMPILSLVTPTAQGIASRILAKTSGGNVTLFAFDAGQGLTEHTSPFEAFVLVLEGALTLTIGGTPLRATPGTIVRMPPNVPHALDAPEAARMLLIMLRDSETPPRK